MSLLPHILTLTALLFHQASAPEVTFRIHLAEAAARSIADLGLEVPIVGRAYVILTRDGGREPRQQVGVSGVPFWGREVRNLTGGEMDQFLE
ncbi:hypothetical protein ACFL3S_12820, partial [Gemmatimonadota bacterium]